MSPLVMLIFFDADKAADAWDKTKEKTHDAYEAVKDTTGNAWEKTKETFGAGGKLLLRKNSFSLKSTISKILYLQLESLHFISFQQPMKVKKRHTMQAKMQRTLLIGPVRTSDMVMKKPSNQLRSAGK